MLSILAVSLFLISCAPELTDTEKQVINEMSYEELQALVEEGESEQGKAIVGKGGHIRGISVTQAPQLDFFSRTVAALDDAESDTTADDVYKFATTVLNNKQLTFIQDLHQCVIPPSGLVSWWDGDSVDLMTDTAFDIRAGHDGTMFGGMTTVPGHVGQAFKFDGDNDFIEIPDHDSFTTSELSVDAWVKVASFATGEAFRPIVTKGDGSGKRSWSFIVKADGRLQFSLSQDGAASIGITTATPVLSDDGLFHHVAVTFDGTTQPAFGTVRMYVDGVQVRVQATSVTSLFKGTAPVRIAASFDFFKGPPAYLWHGLIDEVEIYDRALDASEIEAIYNADSAGKCRLICGDGVIDPGEGEECDDGDTDNNDECTNSCKDAICGDSIIWTTQNIEECDDGNSYSGDGCDSACMGEQGFGCTGEPSVCTQVVCGDGLIEGAEECDDGKANSDVNVDACRLDCKNAFCGDTVVDTGEACDDGNTITETSCEYGTAACTLCDADCSELSLTGPVCGDSTTDTMDGEQCDDGNTVPGDGCSADCVPEEEPVVGCCVQLVGGGCQETDETSCGDLNGAFTQGGFCDPNNQCKPAVDIEPPQDFGDAPLDPTPTVIAIPDPCLGYPTLFLCDGARHIIVPGFFLGQSIDAEPDGQPTVGADGDDNNGVDDEDGVIFVTMPLVRGQFGPIEVTASAPGVMPGEPAGRLDAWIDYNGNFDWDDPGELIFDNVPLVAGVNPLNIKVQDGAILGTTYIRFRYSSAGGLDPFGGPAEDGEVEDYKVEIAAAAVADR